MTVNAGIHIIQTTLPGAWIEAEVGAFAQTLLEAGAACVQHSSIRSTYKWEGAIESSSEWRLQLKVGHSQFDTVMSTLKEAHPYDTPQIVHWAAESTQEYADWVDSA
jgi:periplasmic divalent cation tolerance protein